MNSPTHLSVSILPIKKWTVTNTPKLFAGLTPIDTERAAAFYKTFVDSITIGSSPEVIETAKFLENRFRLVNISFVNEIKNIATKNVLILGWTDASFSWSAVDCAIFTFTNEAIPIALIEAQLAGLPVVTTDVGSASEVVPDSKTGFLTSMNSKEITITLKILMSDSTKLSKMGITPVERAKINFSVTRFIKNHIESYKNFCEKLKVRC